MAIRRMLPSLERKGHCMRDTLQSMPHHQSCAGEFGALQLGILRSVRQKRDSSQS